MLSVAIEWQRSFAPAAGPAFQASEGVVGEAFTYPPITLSAAVRWEPVFDTLLKIGRLADNWDGLGAQVPSSDVVAAAMSFARELCRHGEDPPSSVVASPDGTILFTWRSRFFYQDAEIVSGSGIEFMQVLPGQRPIHWTGVTPNTTSAAQTWASHGFIPILCPVL